MVMPRLQVIAEILTGDADEEIMSFEDSLRDRLLINAGELLAAD